MYRKIAICIFILAGTYCTTEARAGSGDIYVTFYGARVSWANSEYVGHAFMCISLHLNNGVKEDCYGFYPKDSSGAFVGGPGLVHSEFDKKPTRFSRIDFSVSTEITDAGRASIIKEADKWNDKSYDLTDNNCIDFVHAVVKKTSLKRPVRFRTQTPASYVQELQTLNK